MLLELFPFVTLNYAMGEGYLISIAYCHFFHCPICHQQIFISCHILYTPAYKVYRGYIVFAFSVRMLVCVSVCLLTSFPSKISQQLLDLGF